MRKIFFLATSLLCLRVAAQTIPLPTDLPQEHPRLMTKASEKAALVGLVAEQSWAGAVVEGITKRVEPHAKRHVTDPEWMVSRLMMYWKTKASNVYIKGPVYSHADGSAPVPTVRFAASRGGAATHSRPKLEDILPYMDDPRGLYFHNTQKEGNPLEWVEQSKTSGIESINNEIMGYGADAAFLYWLGGDERYAQLAYDLFDTYMMGIYHRNEPMDLNNGHTQTLVGMTYFEVIQERILNTLASLYDFLYPYIEARHPERLETYQATFKKWIDLTIKNGVPQNNWNLIQAKFILSVAMVLEDDSRYADGHGRQYYIDYILNRSSARQWSLTRLMEYGYDYRTGLWNESAGYSQNVTADFTEFAVNFDNTFGYNLLPYMPVMPQAVRVLPQYTFPNGHITAYGDTHYGRLRTSSFADMIRLAQRYGDRAAETEFTAMYKLYEPNAEAATGGERRMAPQISSLFTAKPLVLDPEVKAGRVEDYTTQTFYGPNVSLFIQRNGMDALDGLMISQYASLGNHAHSNGVAMELYGKGYVLGAESGIGTNYFQPDYLEYYSQFPAHNTVMVDGISKYPEMLSNHPFDLEACYPEPGARQGYYKDMSFSQVMFLEPESRSDQRRTLAILRTSPRSGYYVDIFRSARQRGGDKFHDYFYHNLGQTLSVTSADGSQLRFSPSDEMGFAGGHLFALDYMWDKKSVAYTGDFNARWAMQTPSGEVCMNMWMKGAPDREIFTIKAPPTKAFRSGQLPYAADKEPFLTVAARQKGAAWESPFVAVFEPTDGDSSIESIESFGDKAASKGFVGVAVKSKNGVQDYIFSCDTGQRAEYLDMAADATYAVIRRTGNDFVMLLGQGRMLASAGVTITATQDVTAVLEYRSGEYFLDCNGTVVITNAKGKRTTFEPCRLKRIKL